MRSTHSQKVFVAVDLAIIVTLPFFFILFFSRFQSHWSVLLSPFQFRIVVDEYDMAYTVVCIASHRTTSTKSKSNWSIRDSILARLNWQLRWKKKKNVEICLGNVSEKNAAEKMNEKKMNWQRTLWSCPRDERMQLDFVWLWLRRKLQIQTM